MKGWAVDMGHSLPKWTVRFRDITTLLGDARPSAERSMNCCAALHMALDSADTGDRNAKIRHPERSLMPIMHVRKVPT
jgi:hypothetical protein